MPLSKLVRSLSPFAVKANYGPELQKNWDEYKTETKANVKNLMAKVKNKTIGKANALKQKIKEFNEQREQMRKVKELDDKLQSLVTAYSAIDAQIVSASMKGHYDELADLNARLAPEARQLAVQERKVMKEYEKLYPTLTGEAKKQAWHMINGVPDPNQKNQLVGGYVQRLALVKNNTTFLSRNTNIIDAYKHDILYDDTVARIRGKSFKLVPHPDYDSNDPYASEAAYAYSYVHNNPERDAAIEESKQAVERNNIISFDKAREQEKAKAEPVKQEAKVAEETKPKATRTDAKQTVEKQTKPNVNKPGSKEKQTKPNKNGNELALKNDEEPKLKIVAKDDVEPAKKSELETFDNDKQDDEKIQGNWRDDPGKMLKHNLAINMCLQAGLSNNKYMDLRETIADQYARGVIKNYDDLQKRVINTSVSKWKELQIEEHHGDKTAVSTDELMERTKTVQEDLNGNKKQLATLTALQNAEMTTTDPILKQTVHEMIVAQEALFDCVPNKLEPHIDAPSKSNDGPDIGDYM